MAQDRKFETHSDQLRLANQVEETPEVMDARLHVANCPGCMEHEAHVMEMLVKAGIFENERTAETARGLRQRADALQRAAGPS